MSDVVRLRVGGVVFEVEKESLLRFDHTYFHGLFSSGAWQPDADGAYFIDRPAMGFDRILEYLSSGKLSVEGLSELEENCIYSSLDYLLIPYRRHPYRRHWKYNTQTLIEELEVDCVCESKYGRLCGVNRNDIIVWNMDTSAIAMTLNGHTGDIYHVIQLHDGRVCSCSDDSTIKLWSIDSGQCELTLTTGVGCIIQLFDRRVCSVSWDNTIQVWDVLSGVCEITILIQVAVRCIDQLADGRICCLDDGGTISIYNLLNGECELSWKAYPHVYAIVCIESSRVCSSSDGGSINVWNTATGECERTLEGHTDRVITMIQMHDGRLCNASSDGTLKLWNLETGECEKTLGKISNLRCYHFVVQLRDGRLVSSFATTVSVWS